MSMSYDGKSQEELFQRHQELQADKPWFRDQHYFKSCRISRLALMKLWSHAHDGSLNIIDGAPCEIIGILLGFVADEAVSSFWRLSRLGPFSVLAVLSGLFRSLSLMSSKVQTLERGTVWWFPGLVPFISMPFADTTSKWASKQSKLACITAIPA
jgi:hypothetical protein